jgi:hypothetical protein
MQLILNGDSRPIVFAMVQAADHVSPLTGASPAVAIAKNGGAFAAPAGAVSEIANGWYMLTPAAADVATNGALILHATASGGDPADVKCQVVAFSPYDSGRLGLSALPAAAAGSAGGLPLGDAAGKVAINNAGATLDAALSAHDAAGTAGAALGALVGQLTESYAAAGQPGTLAQLLYGLLAVLTNVDQSGTALTARGLDGSTAAMSFTLDNASAPTSRRRTA